MSKKDQAIFKLAMLNSDGATLKIGSSDTTLNDTDVIGTISFTGDDTNVGTNTSHAEIRAYFKGNADTADEKSTNIGLSDFKTSVSKFSSVTFTVAIIIFYIDI